MHQILENFKNSKNLTKLSQLWRFLNRRKILFLLYFVLPLLIAWFIYAVFVNSLPRNLPIGLVDLDKSAMSAEVVFKTNAMPVMKITKEYDSISAAKEDLASAKIYALLVIPHNFERDVNLGSGAKLAFYYNAQFVLIGKSLNAAFAQVSGTLNATQWVAKNLISDQDMKLALSRAMPIFSQIIPLYNANNNYAQFLLTLLLPCMLQILSALGMIGLLRNPPSSSKSLCIRYCFNSLVFLFWGLCMLIFLKNLGYEQRGSLGILIVGLALLLFGVNGVVVFIQSILLDVRKSIGVIAVYTAPSLAFAGITYPQNSMNIPALLWSKFLPISTFMELFVQQANYGGSLEGAFKILGELMIFLLFFALGVGIYALRQKK
ncbi:ABC transporter permease [Helicobacter himalayensis]|uniref:ABC transporter permease n=1 Tax=Helicobacter himalayensis TaxID=1591088 RepID=UPI003D6DB5E9